MIRAHKLVLSAGSGYLERVLAVTPCDHPTVVLANIRYKELKLLIDFVYTGNPAALRQYFYFKRVSFCCGESPGVVDLTWEIFYKSKGGVSGSSSYRQLQYCSLV